MTTDDTTPDAYKVINGRTSEIAEWDWVRTRHGNRLHHLARVDDLPQDRVFVVYDGRTTCGVEGRLMIPASSPGLGFPAVRPVVTH